MLDARQFLERAFPDHSIGDRLREDRDGALFRGRRKPDGRSVLLLTAAVEHPAPEWLARLERKFALRDVLELPWAARPLSLSRPEGRAVLIMEDPGGKPSIETIVLGGDTCYLATFVDLTEHKRIEDQ